MEYLILIVSLVGIVFGADFLVAGAVSIARKFKVSDFVIGAAIVGVGTSMPELVVSFIGAVNGNADVAIGNVVGSNIFNVLGILGLTAVLFPVAVDKKNMRFEIPLCIGVSVLLTLLVFNFFNGASATIGRVDGVILLLLFAFFMWFSFRRDRKDAPVEESAQEDATPLWKAILKVVGGLALLITSCDFFVDNAVLIAKSFGVNDAFISLTLIACGTSLPELATCIVAARKGRNQMALGNVIGSNIANILLIVGGAALISPLSLTSIAWVDFAVMMVASLVLLMSAYTIKRDRIDRREGLLFIVIEVAYMIWLFLNA